MAGTVMPAPKFIGLDNNANPVSGGKLYTYVAGTTTPQATYSDVDLTIANTNPVVLDSAGRATVFLSGASYKFVLTDANDAAIWTQDNVQAVAPFSTNLDVLGTAGEAILAGQACYLSDGSGGKTAGKWYLADADNAYSSSLPQIAMAPDAVAQDASGTFRLQGAATKANTQAAFVVGSTYYLAGGASKGLLSLTPGTNQRIMGQADSTTTIVISPNPPNVAVTPTFVNGITVTSTDGGATAAPYLDLYRESASPAASDQIGELRFSGEDSAGNKQLYARIYGQIADATSTTEDGQVRVAVVSNGAETLMLVLTESGAVLPDLTTQDLGSGAKPWRNVFLGGTGKLDFGNGDVTVTASSNTLTFAGAASGYVFDNDLKMTVGEYIDWGTTVGSFGGRFGRYLTGSFLIGVPGTSSSESFLVVNSAGVTIAEFRGDKFASFAGNIAIGATARIYLDGVAGTGDTYLEEVTANELRIVAAGNERLRAVGASGVQITGALTVASGTPIYLDGSFAGDTYVFEPTGNSLALVAGGNERLRAVGSDGVKITGALTVPSGTPLYFDGSFSGDTYAFESSANVFELIVGGTSKIRAAQTGISVSTSPTTIIANAGGLGSFVVVNGNDGSNRFCDLVLASTATAPTVVSSYTSLGSPAARTYTRSGDALLLAMASGTYAIHTVKLGS